MKQEILYMRVIAMLMVIFYHSVCFYTRIWGAEYLYVPAWQFVASFLNYIDMPAFVFISGYLYAFMKFEKGKYGNERTFLKEKAKRLMIPYIVWTAINIMLIPSTFSVAWIFKGYSHLWFLMMLMMVFVIVVISQRFWSRFNMVKYLVWIGSLIITTLVISKFHIDSWLCWKQTLRYLPYFIIGIMFIQYRQLLMSFCLKYKFLTIIVALVILVSVSYTNSIEWSFRGWYQLSSMFIYASVSILLLTICTIFSDYSPPPLSKIAFQDYCDL